MNSALFRELNGLAGHGVVLDDLIRALASFAIFGSFAALAWLSLVRLRRREVGVVIWAGTGLAAAYGLGLLGAALVSEQRPFTTLRHVHLLIQHKPGQSFPSDHATAAFAIALVTLVWLSRRWGLALLGLAVLIALSRVAAGVHYPGDVLGSLLVSVLGVGGVALVAGRMGTRRADILPR